MARAPHQGTGRRKIDIKKIENKLHLKTTFTKRRKGLFKKVEDFCTSSGTDAAAFTFSPYGRAYAFGNPSVGNVIERFYSEGAVIIGSPSTVIGEEEKDEEEEEEDEERNWWEKPVEDLEIYEIEKFRESLTEFKRNLTQRIKDLHRRRQAEMGLFI